MSEDLAALYAVYEVAIEALVEHEKRGYERDELNDKMCDQWDHIKKIWRGEIEFDAEKDKHEAMKAAWEEMMCTRSAFRTAHKIVKEAEKKVDPLIHKAYMTAEKTMKVVKLHHVRYVC